MTQVLSFLEQIDISILFFIQNHLRNPLFDRLFIPITHFADDGIFWILLVLVLIWAKKTRRAGMAALFSMAICYILTSMWLKDFVGRIRPYETYSSLVLLVEKDPDFSFPSGHTVISFAAALIYVRMLEKPFGIATLLLAILIGFSRLYVGIHYPSDVLGGFLLALAVSSVVYVVFQWRAGTRK